VLADVQLLFEIEKKNEAKIYMKFSFLRRLKLRLEVVDGGDGDVFILPNNNSRLCDQRSNPAQLEVDD
ncbi:hypothetical protein HDU99_008331, partial [Rhizoclosmatium hyalinum]